MNQRPRIHCTDSQKALVERQPTGAEGQLEEIAHVADALRFFMRTPIQDFFGIGGILSARAQFEVVEQDEKETQFSGDPDRRPALR
jgi:hypothetical protein